MVNWFLNLKSKVKLYLLSGILLSMLCVVSAIGIVSTMQSIYAAEEINLIVNRSATRTLAVQNTIRSFDNKVLRHLVLNEDRVIDTNKLRSETFDELKMIVDAVKVMNPKVIGNLPAPDYHSQNIIELQKVVAQMESKYLNEFMRTCSDPQNVGKYADIYVDQLRPFFSKSYEYINALLKEQHRTTVLLARQAADMSWVYITLGVTALAFIVGFILSWIIVSYINKCITRQRNFMREMVNGNFDFEIQGYNNDDFGEIIDLIRKTRDSMNKALSLVIKDSASTESSMNQLHVISQDVSRNLGECESLSLSVSAASEQMLSTTQDIAKNCDDASRLSATTRNIMINGVEAIKGTINEIRRQSEIVHDNSKAVEKVAKRSKDISSIVNTIEEIASQTNLLALNAAIEAARAGEAGRGFAVVADEVRALASRTASSTQEIASMVHDIQEDAVSAAESINRSVESMEEASNHTAEVEGTMHEMLEHIEHVSMQITQIASAAEEQTAATNEISTNIHEVNNFAQVSNRLANDAGNILQQSLNGVYALQKSLSYFKISQQ